MTNLKSAIDKPRKALKTSTHFFPPHFPKILFFLLTTANYKKQTYIYTFFRLFPTSNHFEQRTMRLFHPAKSNKKQMTVTQSHTKNPAIKNSLSQEETTKTTAQELTRTTTRSLVSSSSFNLKGKTVITPAMPNLTISHTQPPPIRGNPIASLANYWPLTPQSSTNKSHNKIPN